MIMLRIWLFAASNYGTASDRQQHLFRKNCKSFLRQNLHRMCVKSFKVYTFKFMPRYISFICNFSGSISGCDLCKFSFSLLGLWCDLNYHILIWSSLLSTKKLYENCSMVSEIARRMEKRDKSGSRVDELTILMNIFSANAEAQL